MRRFVESAPLGTYNIYKYHRPGRRQRNIVLGAQELNGLVLRGPMAPGNGLWGFKIRMSAVDCGSGCLLGAPMVTGNGLWDPKIALSAIDCSSGWPCSRVSVAHTGAPKQFSVPGRALAGGTRANFNPFRDAAGGCQALARL